MSSLVVSGPGLLYASVCTQGISVCFWEITPLSGHGGACPSSPKGRSLANPQGLSKLCSSAILGDHRLKGPDCESQTRNKPCVWKAS